MSLFVRAACTSFFFFSRLPSLFSLIFFDRTGRKMMMMMLMGGGPRTLCLSVTGCAITHRFFKTFSVTLFKHSLFLFRMRVVWFCSSALSYKHGSANFFSLCASCLLPFLMYNNNKTTYALSHAYITSLSYISYHATLFMLSSFSLYIL